MSKWLLSWDMDAVGIHKLLARLQQRRLFSLDELNDSANCR